MSNTLKLRAIAIVIALGLFGVALNASKIYDEWQRIGEAQSVSTASHALAKLSDASIRLSAERSFTQLTLALDAPVTPEFRKRIEAQRNLVDADFAGATDFLATASSGAFAHVNSRIVDQLAELSKLRSEADRLLLLQKVERPLERISGIPDALKSLVTEIHAIRLRLRGSNSNIMATVGLLEQAQDRALKLREFAGRDRTLLATALARQDSFASETIASMGLLHGRVLETLKELDSITEQNGIPSAVRTKFVDFQATYLGSYSKLRDSLIVQGRTAAPLYSVTFAQFFEQSSAVLEDAEKLGSLLSAKIDGVWSEEQSRLQVAMVWDGGILALFLGLAGAAIWVFQSLFRRLDRLRLVMGSLANGALTIAVPDLTSRDEIGEMARTVKHFQDVGLEKQAVEAAAATQRDQADAARQRAADEKARLELAADAERTASQQVRLAAAEEEAKASKERAQAIEKIGQGLSRLAENDLSFRLTGEMPAAYKGLMQDFNSAVSNLSSALASIRQGTEAIASGTREIAQAADDLSRRTESQAANLEETAGAVLEISNVIKVSAQSAASARDYVADANGDAQKSSAIVAKAVEAMNRIETSSIEIGKIISVIDEIAFQTNLLALNAGVEAARAGEAGRGFAVVATEVRALAQRSADAAKQIRVLISTSSEQVNNGVELVDQAGQSLQRIMAKVQEINGLVSDIAGRATEQSLGLSQVSTTVTQMDQATQQNAAMVEETTAATRSLSEESQNLLSLVSQFKLGGAPTAQSIVTALEGGAPHLRQQLNARFR